MTTADVTGPLLANRQILADEVYGILKSWLESGRIAPGERMKIDKLAEELGISNTPIRQALGRLESDGLVVKEAYKGFTAAHMPGRRTIDEFYEFRILVEPAASAKASLAAGASDIAFLHEQMEIGSPETAATLGSGVLRTADEQLHCRLADMGNNGFVADTLRRLFVQSSLFRAIYLRHDALPSTYSEHQLIVAAIADHDSAKAEAAMRAHLVAARARMLDVVDNGD